MSKEKQVTIKIDTRQAAAVRQILFDAQKGYTYDQVSVPPRIADVRSVIRTLDEEISKKVYKDQSECPPGTIFINGECASI